MADTTNNSGAGKPSGLGSSLLATRAANTVRYSVMNLFILLGIAATAYGGPFTFSGLLFSFFLVGYVDELFGDAGSKEAMPPIW
ncbi:MAG: hypothetical protein Q7T08_12350, partial [Devosia sp.]|nr:hypothetical protein [Devosia sp.]